MKDSIYAVVDAYPISFPDEIETRHIPVNPLGEPEGTRFYKRGPFTWWQVRGKHSIGDDFAEECEKLLRAGRPVRIEQAQEWPDKWPEPGDPEFELSDSSN